jgi:hypothetical protein
MWSLNERSMTLRPLEAIGSKAGGRPPAEPRRVRCLTRSDGCEISAVMPRSRSVVRTAPVHGALLQPVAKERLNRQRWQAREQPRLAIVVWIEKTYDRRPARTPSAR